MFAQTGRRRRAGHVVVAGKHLPAQLVVEHSGVDAGADVRAAGHGSCGAPLTYARTTPSTRRRHCQSLFHLNDIRSGGVFPSSAPSPGRTAQRHSLEAFRTNRSGDGEKLHRQAS